jgi:CheY-like chemotaxis protein
MTQTCLLYVDNDPGFGLFYQAVLRSYGFVVDIATSAVAAMERIHSSAIDAVMVSHGVQLQDFQPRDPQSNDFQSQSLHSHAHLSPQDGCDGFALAVQIKQQAPDVPVVLLSPCESVVEDATRFVDGAFCTRFSVLGLVDLLEKLTGHSASAGVFLVQARESALALPLASMGNAPRHRAAVTMAAS